MVRSVGFVIMKLWGDRIWYNLKNPLESLHVHLSKIAVITDEFEVVVTLDLIADSRKLTSHQADTYA